VFIEAKDDGGGGDNWKSPPTNQHPVFYRPDALPVAQPCQSTEGKGMTFLHCKYMLPCF